MSILDFFAMEKCTDFVDLSIGRVYIRPISNGVVRFVDANSRTIVGSTNVPLYYNLMEDKIVKLSRKKIDALSLDDGNKLRDKVKEILIRHGLISVTMEDEENEFTESDKNAFKVQEQELLNKMRLKQDATSSKGHS